MGNRVGVSLLSAGSSPLRSFVAVLPRSIRVRLRTNPGTHRFPNCNRPPATGKIVWESCGKAEHVPTSPPPPLTAGEPERKVVRAWTMRVFFRGLDRDYCRNAGRAQRSWGGFTGAAQLHARQKRDGDSMASLSDARPAGARPAAIGRATIGYSCRRCPGGGNET